MEWLELTIQTSSAGIEWTAAALTQLGYDSFVLDDQAEFQEFLEENHAYWDYVDEDLAKKMQGRSQIRLYLENTPAALEQVLQLRTNLSSLPQRWPEIDFGALTVTMENVRQEDWENNWKQYYQPIRIGEKLLVVPQWLCPENPEGRIAVRLDPGMIFGTGNHASTRMCMQQLERYTTSGAKVLDLGSGSGILSITALLLGAASATGVDIDPKAEDIARENAAFNALGADRFTALTGNVLDQASGLLTKLQIPGGYDLVLANIVADVIIPLSALVPALLAKQGVFLCSGILASRLPDVLGALTKAGFCILETNQEEDWCQITAKQREG